MKFQAIFNISKAGEVSSTIKVYVYIQQIFILIITNRTDNLYYI